MVRKGVEGRLTATTYEISSNLFKFQFVDLLLLQDLGFVPCVSTKMKPATWCARRVMQGLMQRSSSLSHPLLLLPSLSLPLSLPFLFLLLLPWPLPPPSTIFSHGHERRDNNKINHVVNIFCSFSSFLVLLLPFSYVLSLLRSLKVIEQKLIV